MTTLTLLEAKARFELKLSRLNSPRYHYHSAPLTLIKAFGDAAIAYREAFWNLKGKQIGFIKTLKAAYGRSQLSKVYRAITIANRWQTIVTNGWLELPLRIVLTKLKRHSGLNRTA